MIKPYFETELGKLYHGDCLEIMQMIKDNRINIVLTDPPYGIDIAKNGTVGVECLMPLKNYGIQTWDSKTPNKIYFDEILRISKYQIIFGGNYFTDKLPINKCWICWDKGIPKGYTKSQIELAWTNLTTYARIYKVLWNGMIRKNEFDEKTRKHPTQKPLNLFKSIINDFTNKDELICDPYIGSGTTAIACEQLNRRWIGIEINKEYCDIAVDRIKKETAQLKLSF